VVWFSSGESRGAGADLGLPKGKPWQLASMESEHIMGHGADPEAESIVHFHTKEGLKVKDFSDSSSPCPRQTASHIHDQLLLLINGGGGRPGRPTGSNYTKNAQNHESKETLNIVGMVDVQSHYYADNH